MLFRSRADQAETRMQAMNDKFASTSKRTVVNFTIFRQNEIDGMVISTGWAYQSATDTAPTSQYCKVFKRNTPQPLQLLIAAEGRPLQVDRLQATRADIDAEDIKRALPQCEWFSGENPNICSGT